MLDEKTDPKNSGQSHGKNERTLTKLTVSFQGSGAFEGKSLQEAFKDFPKGTKIEIGGKTFTI